MISKSGSSIRDMVCFLMNCSLRGGRELDRQHINHWEVTFLLPKILWDQLIVLYSWHGKIAQICHQNQTLITSSAERHIWQTTAQHERSECVGSDSGLPSFAVIFSLKWIAWSQAEDSDAMILYQFRILSMFWGEFYIYLLKNWTFTDANC